MHRRTFKSALVMALLVAGSAATTSAQDKISPAKRELIKEILVVTDLQREVDTTLKLMFDRQEKEEPKRIAEQVTEMAGLTPEEKEKLRQELTESNARYYKRFKELVRQKLNLAKIIEGVLYPIYDKYYTEDELREQLAFLKTPAGKKMMETMSQMMSEMMTNIEDVMRPRLAEIAKQIMEEERKREEK